MGSIILYIEQDQESSLVSDMSRTFGMTSNKRVEQYTE